MMKKQLLILFITLLLLAGCGSPEPVAELSGNLTITAPDQIKAGEPVEIKVSSPFSAEGTPVSLVLEGSYGPGIYSGKLQKGVGIFKVPGTDTRKSGSVKLVALAGKARGEASFEILPGPAVDGVTPLVGAREITADGEHWSMAVMVPFDAYGNPLAKGTAVQVRALRPDNTTEGKMVFIDHLLAWTKITSGTKAGRTTLAAQVDGARGTEVALLEVAGWPVNFNISPDLTDTPADGRKLVTLRTSILTDKFGNMLPDGTLVTFIVGGAGVERRQIPSQVIGGVAVASIQAPDKPITLEIKAIVYDRESSTLQLPFAPGPATGTFPVSVKKDTARLSLVVEVGPMVGALGQYVPDGTEVTISVKKPGSQTQVVSAKATKGRASAELRLAGFEVGTYTVEVSAGSGHGSATFTIP